MLHSARVILFHGSRMSIGHQTSQQLGPYVENWHLPQCCSPFTWTPYHTVLVITFFRSHASLRKQASSMAALSHDVGLWSYIPISFHNPCCHHHPGFYHRHNGQLIHRTATAQYLANQISDSFYSHHRTSHHRTSHHRTSHHRT